MPSPLVSTRPAMSADPAGTRRLAWLDAARGIAALLVAFHHACFYYLPEFQATMSRWFDPGTCGLMIFFLVSGYIVPASLERTGDVRGFWVGRLFRVHPLGIATLAVVVLLAVTGTASLRTGLGELDPSIAVIAHLTLLQDLLSVTNATIVLWSLSYEMAFYLLVVALFVVRAHPRSAGVASCLAVASVAFGGLLPVTALSRGIGVEIVVLGTAALMAAAVAGALSGRPALRTAGGLLGGALAIVLVTVNGRVPAWEGLIIMAALFTGTALYRAERRQISRAAGAATAGFVLVCAVATGVLHSGDLRLPPAADAAYQRGWATAITLAAVVFGTGMALRHRAIARWLTWLGTVSYSIYLLHPLVILGMNLTIGRSQHDDLARFALFPALLLPLSWGTYRLVEAPGQRLGRLLARRLGPSARQDAPSPL